MIWTLKLSSWMGSSHMGLLAQLSHLIRSCLLSHTLTAQAGDLWSIALLGKTKDPVASTCPAREVVTIPSQYQRFSANGAAIFLMRFRIEIMSFLVTASAVWSLAPTVRTSWAAAVLLLSCRWRQDAWVVQREKKEHLKPNGISVCLAGQL